MKPITEQEARDYFINAGIPVNQSHITAFMLGYNKGIQTGYDEGFQVAQAAERGIIALDKKIKEFETPAPTSDLASNGGGGSPSTAGEVHPVIDNILNIIRP